MKNKSRPGKGIGSARGGVGCSVKVVGLIGEVTFEQRLERDQGLSHGDVHGKSIPVREDSQYKGLKW